MFAELDVENDQEVEMDGVLLGNMPPLALPELVERRFFRTKMGVLRFYESFDRWDTHELTLRLGLDGRYAIDIEPVPETGSN